MPTREAWTDPQMSLGVCRSHVCGLKSREETYTLTRGIHTSSPTCVCVYIYSTEARVLLHRFYMFVCLSTQERMTRKISHTCGRISYVICLHNGESANAERSIYVVRQGKIPINIFLSAQISIHVLYLALVQEKIRYY